MKEPKETPAEVSPESVLTPAKLLEELTAQVDDLEAIVVGVLLKDGGATVRSTPMSPPMLNHLARILNVKVDTKYRMALMGSNAPRPPVGASGKALPPKVAAMVQLAEARQKRGGSGKAKKGK